MDGGSLSRAAAEVSAEGSDRALVVEALVEWLTGGEGPEMLHLAGVQRFAWYELPLKWLIPEDEHRIVLDVAGDLFERADMPLYAEVFRSPLTAEIHAAYRASDKAGYQAFLKAYKRSGVNPPDLNDFGWSQIMGFEEVAARDAVEHALEEAMASGRFTPGKRGWKTAAAEVTAAVVDAPHPDLPGQTRRTAILTERLDNWLRSAERHSPGLYALRSRHVKRLLHPIPAPLGFDERFEPVIWFLDRVDQGAVLTDADYLPTAMVREVSERYGWRMRFPDRPARSESELGELAELHELLRRVGAVRRRGKSLYVSSTGRAMREDPDTLWRTIAAGLSEAGFVRAVAEVYTLLLLDGPQLDDDLKSRALSVLGEYGWRTDGELPTDREVARAWWGTRWPLTVFGGLEHGGDWSSRTTRLTEFGETLLLEQIRVEATGPRSTRW